MDMKKLDIQGDLLAHLISAFTIEINNTEKQSFTKGELLPLYYNFMADVVRGLANETWPQEH